MSQSSVETFINKCRSVYGRTTLLELSVHGWEVHAAQIESFFRQHHIQTVVEVGAWLGKWTLFVGNLLPKRGKLYAVDHWRGSLEHQVNGTLAHGLLPTLYQQFLSNVLHSHLAEKVVPVKMESLKAASKFRKLSIQADLIYIDASHDYFSVLDDITAWFPLLREGGIFCGDDWSWGSVAIAVQQYARFRDLKVHVEDNLWLYH